MTRRTRCSQCGCHEFDQTEQITTAGVILLWKCWDCGAETPRVNSRQLAQRKSKLIFETSATIKEQGRHRAIVVEPEPLTVKLHLKGLRRTYELSWEGIFHFAAKVAANKAKAEKKMKRKEGKL